MGEVKEHSINAYEFGIVCDVCQGQEGVFEESGLHFHKARWICTHCYNEANKYKLPLEKGGK